MSSVLVLALHTARECHRRALPYVLIVVTGLVTLCSLVFQAFSFGAAELEAVNLGLSAVFLAGLAYACLLGTQLVRADIERGTFGLLLTQPVSLPSYLAGRYLGLAASSLLLSGAVAGAVSCIFLLPLGRVGETVFGADLYWGWARALFPILILDAAAIAASAIMARAFGPLALLGLFLAGSVVGDSAFGFVVPDFGLFRLEAGAAPSWAWLASYTAVFSTAYLLLAYMVLASRPPLRSQA